MVDLAVPRDVESEVAELDDVFLYYVDDLSEIVKEGLDSRQSAVEQAEIIIDTNVDDFMRWMASSLLPASTLPFLGLPDASRASY